MSGQSGVCMIPYFDYFLLGSIRPSPRPSLFSPASLCSGNPELRLALNDDLVVGKSNASAGFGSVVLDVSPVLALGLRRAKLVKNVQGWAVSVFGEILCCSRLSRHPKFVSVVGFVGSECMGILALCCVRVLVGYGLFLFSHIPPHVGKELRWRVEGINLLGAARRDHQRECDRLYC